MPNEYSGDPIADSASCFAIVVSRYNETITGRLLDGALRTLRDAQVTEQQIDAVWVPGAWELPVIANQLAHSGRYAAVVCLGAVIRGETTHDQYINQQVSESLGRIALETGVPILFGVLTCNTLEQALQRAGGNQGNKGAECAEAALRMADLMRKLP
jgi:6,7-dimethyl-8-ribityllumazine synthase